MLQFFETDKTHSGNYVAAVGFRLWGWEVYATSSNDLYVGRGA